MPTLADRVTLREITAETVRAVINLSVTEHQKRFVASNAVSLAQALFAPEAWYRAIYLDEEPGRGSTGRSASGPPGRWTASRSSCRSH